jgi:hypothetical protein
MAMAVDVDSASDWGRIVLGHCGGVSVKTYPLNVSRLAACSCGGRDASGRAEAEHVIRTNNSLSLQLFAVLMLTIFQNMEETEGIMVFVNLANTCGEIVTLLAA